MRTIILLFSLFLLHACVVKGPKHVSSIGKIEVIDPELASVLDTNARIEIIQKDMNGPKVRFGLHRKINSCIPIFHRTGSLNGQKKEVLFCTLKNQDTPVQKQEAVNWVPMGCCWIEMASSFFVSMATEESLGWMQR